MSKDNGLSGLQKLVILAAIGFLAVVCGTSEPISVPRATEKVDAAVVQPRELSAEERKAAYLKEREKEGWKSCVWSMQIRMAILDGVKISENRYYRQDEAMDSCHKRPETWKPFGGQSPPEDFKVPDSWKPGRVWDPETSTFKDVITQ